MRDVTEQRGCLVIAGLSSFENKIVFIIFQNEEMKNQCKLIVGVHSVICGVVS